MNTEPTSSTAEVSGHSPFPKTLWTECVELASEGNSSASEAALRQLCADYREPILVWLRRRGTDQVAAEDLTHGFIAFLLESNRLGSVERGKGRFRSFLLKCLTHLAPVAAFNLQQTTVLDSRTNKSSNLWRNKD